MDAGLASGDDPYKMSGKHKKQTDRRSTEDCEKKQGEIKSD